MEPYTCDAGRHLPQIDDDGDTVCMTCRRVLHVGPLGVNGFVMGERIGFVSALACIEDDIEERHEALAADAESFKASLARSTARAKHKWARQDKSWLRESA